MTLPSKRTVLNVDEQSTGRNRSSSDVTAPYWSRAVPRAAGPSLPSDPRRSTVFQLEWRPPDAASSSVLSVWVYRRCRQVFAESLGISSLDHPPCTRWLPRNTVFWADSGRFRGLNLPHEAVHHLYHLHYHHFHLFSFVQAIILTLRLGSLANPFHHRPFLYLPQWPVPNMTYNVFGGR